MYEGFLGIRPITSWKLQGLVAPNQNPSAHFGSLPLKKIQCDYSCTITRGIQITIYTTVPLRHREMGLWTLLEGFLLLANALAILNEDRLLAPRGWSFQEFSGVKRNSFKGQIIGLIYAVQYLRVPLVLLNSLCIVVKLVFG